MSAFREFEISVLRLLVAPRLGGDSLEAIVREAAFVSYNYSGSGYFVTVKHPSLPSERVVCAEPQVVGRSGKVQSGFVAFIENGELTLECHTWGEIDVPENFRDRQVVVEAT